LIKTEIAVSLCPTSVVDRSHANGRIRPTHEKEHDKTPEVILTPILANNKIKKLW